MIVNRQPQAPPPTAGRLTRYLKLLRDSYRRRTLLCALYQKFDLRRRQHPDPPEFVDCADILAKHERLDVVPITKRFVRRFPPEAIAAVRSQDFDVLVRFGFNILRGEILTSARYGVWSFHHGDNEFYPRRSGSVLGSSRGQSAQRRDSAG